MVRNYFPKRGDLVFMNFNPQSGHEQKGHRPALVISHDDFNAVTPFVAFCPITSTPPRNNFHVELAGTKFITGTILSDQFRTLDSTSSGIKFVEKCPDEMMQAVLDRVEAILF